MRIFLGGEGTDELGRWGWEASYRDQYVGLGVIEALLHKLRAEGWTISGGRKWSQIRKYRLNLEVREAEMQNVMGLAPHADDHACEALVFVRDRDRDPQRQSHVEAGIEHATARFPSLRIAGGVAIEELEAWLLALLGESRSERHGDAKAELANRHGIETGEDMVAAVEKADLTNLPNDAGSLRRWLDATRNVLNEGGTSG